MNLLKLFNSIMSDARHREEGRLLGRTAIYRLPTMSPAALIVMPVWMLIAQMVKSWVVVYLFSNLGLVSWRWFRGHLGDKG